MEPGTESSQRVIMKWIEVTMKCYEKLTNSIKLINNMKLLLEDYTKTNLRNTLY